LLLSLKFTSCFWIKPDVKTKQKATCKATAIKRKSGIYRERERGRKKESPGGSLRHRGKQTIKAAEDRDVLRTHTHKHTPSHTHTHPDSHAI